MKNELKTNNPEWGFYGTIRTALRDDNAKALEIWNAMVRKIKELCPKESDDEIRGLLDSRIGRHLADEVGVNQGMRRPSFIHAAINEMSEYELNTWWNSYRGCKRKDDNLKSVYLAALKHEATYYGGIDKICEAAGKKSSESNAWVWIEQHENNEPELKKMLRKIGYAI